MPTYDYECSNCNHTFTEFCSISKRFDPENSPCAKCKQLSVKLIIGASSLISPFAVDGLKKPQSDFRERMQQIKHGYKNVKSVKLKDY
jgi:putative FmdB family regulatory protein